MSFQFDPFSCEILKFYYFKFQVMPWRIISSVIRGLILQISALFAYNCLLSFAPLTPIQWITSNFVVFITPTSWFYDLIIVACFAGLAFLQSKELRMVNIN